MEKAELTKIVEQYSSIELSKSQKIAALFAEPMDKVNELSPVIHTLNRENPTEEDSKKARDARLALVRNRSTLKQIKETLKRGIIDEGKLIDGLYNFVDKSSTLLESDLEQVEKFVENREKERKEALKVVRTSELLAIDTDVTFFNLGEMPEDQYQKLKESAMIAFKLAEDKRKKEEDERIEKERQDAEHRAKIAKENDELREKLAKQDRENREAAEKAAADAKKLADEQKKKDDEIAKLKKEAAEKAAAEAKRVEEQKKKDEDERLKKLKEERDALLAPDKEKIKKYFDQIMAIEQPILQDVQIHIQFEQFIKSITNLITNFK